MLRATCWAILIVVALTALPVSAEIISVYRDQWGVPHIFAETEAGVAYAMGYCQAEDRLEGVLRNYLQAEGRMAEKFGEQHYNADFRARMWRHYAKSEEHYMKKSEKIRAITEAFIAGLKKYMADHPEKVPTWAPEPTPYHVSAVGRHLIWGWPEGEAADDLRRGGLRYAPNEYHGSNQWLISADRTTLGAPIALIDPHLSWYGFFRFYEARYYGGDLAYSGMAVPGLPLGTLGHSEYCSVAMTTGGPDTADVFHYPINPENPLQYEYEGQWHNMKVVKEQIGVRKSDGVEYEDVEFHYTHTGPVVAREDGKAYVMAIPYFEEIYHLDQVYAMNTARNIEEMREAFRMLQYMAQNIMVGTVDGDIFYLRNGRVPIRPPEYNYTRPVNGETSATAWLGLHKVEDLVQILNPRQGYMQNCNVSPYVMMKDSPLIPERYPGYIYGAGKTPPHQRAAMTLHQLAENKHVTLEDAKDMALSTEVFGAENWIAALESAMENVAASADARAMFNYVHTWDRHSRPDSAGALAYKYWKNTLWENYLSAEDQRRDRYGMMPQTPLTDRQYVDALEVAAMTMKHRYGQIGVPFGAEYRVARRNNDGAYTESWPVGGGNPGNGMATPRNIGFTEVDDTTYIGRSGQTSTQLVVLSKPPKSWTMLPLGNSDHPSSPHYTDQARELMSPGELKPTYFLDKDELMKHATSEMVLEFNE